MAKNIVSVNERYYQHENGERVPVKAVLVLGIDALYRGYVACGSDQFVADYGTKMLFTEASVHFPNVPEEKYAFQIRN